MIRDQLVFDYRGEEVSLPTVSLEHRLNLPDEPGVYLVVLENGEVLYVGKSINIKHRWSAHHRYYQLQSQNVFIAWMLVDDISLLHEVEAYLIKEFAPSMNNSPVKSPLLKRTFQIRESIRIRLIKAQFIIWEKTGVQVDREVMVEEAIVQMLSRLEAGDKDLEEKIVQRQRQREQELATGALINPSSRKNGVN